MVVTVTITAPYLSCSIEYKPKLVVIKDYESTFDAV